MAPTENAAPFTAIFVHIPGAMPRPPQQLFQLRSMAADAYLEANRIPKQAAAILKAKLGGRMGLSRPAAFCQKWGERRLQTHTVDDAPRSGRPKQLSEQHVDAVITALSYGYLRLDSTGPTRVPFSSWSFFTNYDPTAISVLSATKVTPRHLLRACLATMPTLKRKKIQLRVWLRPATKAERVADCQNLLGKTDRWFQSVIWVDAKTLYINPTTAYAWVNTADMAGHTLEREDRRVRPKPSQAVKLKFYIAVNALMGAVALVWVTGTSGLTAARLPIPYLPYMVSGFL